MSRFSRVFFTLFLLAPAGLAANDKSSHGREVTKGRKLKTLASN
jgi:hypothetical protein